MLNKLLDEIIVSVVGKSAEGIVPLLNTSKYVNEFIIAKKLGITINQTRNILYKISDYGLVSSVRKKDKKKGWYTYYWKFEIMKCLEFLRDFLIKSRLEIEDQVKTRNSKVFYACESCGLEYDEDEALLMNFTCDECGEIFTVKDNSKLIKEMGRNTTKFDEKLKIVQEEIGKEQSKLGKKKAVGLKKEEKENEKRKAEAKERRDQKRKEKKASLPAKKPKTEKKTKKVKENVKSKSKEKIQSRKSVKKSSKKKK
ncbi:hypothetical protein COT60_02120 [Candidatus Pacearchaeota archaeon CG09_land_8_20_14_0_10_30_9]|nr:hypothetical protein [Candidatus Pacearchaeota archaeon]OIO40129.1 MAG: hypothetical protein AUJ61_02535 [Candidatus Pacearchaeota archaeon CG1_02_30_18]PIN71161.1 MAG: hypothetical protein COV77_03330 [Candidatus Pacearchaeota archaeon CG11_big_fil_rev_8_21_14_0_20_30_13]PIO01106.1 MAG: hypothetical protein COT60_02120 [Candidatus Pacearchaeota archaeon CG09_land_8_20_14_0_10_30_9]PIZ82009.1 MAG: hypothetical protein COX98_01535 [Candidatus Pacearchaeota archaeon CG_4_10_14_0_2_um_filter_30